MDNFSDITNALPALPISYKEARNKWFKLPCVKALKVNNGGIMLNNIFVPINTEKGLTYTKYYIINKMGSKVYGKFVEDPNISKNLADDLSDAFVCLRSKLSFGYSSELMYLERLKC
jgi:hypothetical protein